MSCNVRQPLSWYKKNVISREREYAHIKESVIRCIESGLLLDAINIIELELLPAQSRLSLAETDLNAAKLRERAEEIIQKAKEVQIVSGEGEQGTVEDYDGEKTVQALKNRLKEEQCGGDRWAYARIDGTRYDLKNDFLRPRH